MARFLQLALWNANGLTQHTEELKAFISIHNIDVMLISETHFTEKSYLKLPNYTVYHMNYPTGTAIIIIIKNTIKHHQLNNYSQDFLQATSVSVEDLTILAVYLPPKHTVKQEQLKDFYNGKKQLKHLSTEEPTYWPCDRNKLPNLVDFCVTRGIPQDFTVAKSCFDLSSNHSLVLITLTPHALNQEKQQCLRNRHTNWDDFRHVINQRLTLTVSLKTKEDIEAAVKFFNDTVQWAGWKATPEHADTFKTYDCCILSKQKNQRKKTS
jgi:hypothetical protein